MSLAKEGKNLWVVCWRYNGEYHEKEFGTRILAEAEMIKLEAYGFAPTIHYK